MGNTAQNYFQEAWRGTHCQSNWYEGNPGGTLGAMGQPPTFTADAVALLGFDETIDKYCGQHRKTNPDAKNFGGYAHARNCVMANLNILSLYGTRVPYNICRNLEWQVCAARGKLPGQASPTIIFSHEPSQLDPRGQQPFGKCRGFREEGVGPCNNDQGYATVDIYFLEICIYNQICKNSKSLFKVKEGQRWQCQLDEGRFNELQAMLIAEPDYSTGSTSHGLPRNCQAWCSKYTATQPQCKACMFERRI